MRQLWHRRRRSAVIAGVMALAIGSCVTVFSMFAAVLLAEWPYADVNRLVVIWHARANSPGVVGMSAGDIGVYRASLRTVDETAAVTTRGYNAGATNAGRVICARMTPEMFPMLGVPALRGRWFTADEDHRRESVVVLSERMWRAQLGADPAFPGGDLLLDAVPHRVVGIMPEVFAFPPEGVQGLAAAECWVPASYTAAELAAPGFHFVLFAKLKAGVTVAQAASDANASAHEIWRRYPAAVQSQVALEARVVSLSEQVAGGSRTRLYLFAGAALLLLLIGCTNVANFLLADLDVRRRELAVRVSLGASGADLIGQLLLESIVLAIAGGIAGALLASALVAALTAVDPEAFPRLADARVDPAVLVFALACSVAAGLLGGLAPAWQLRAPQAPGTGYRVADTGLAKVRWRQALVAFQIALAVTVLAFAGVLTRSMLHLQAVRPGFMPDNLLAFSVALPPSQYARPGQTIGFAAEVLRQLEETAGITHAAAGSALPVGSAVATVVAPAAGGGSTPKYQPTLVNAVTPEYALAIGMTVAGGRFVEASDQGSALPVAVINETLAQALWPGEPALGRAIAKVGDQTTLTVVGIVGDVRQNGPVRPAVPMLYVPMAQASEPVGTLHFVVRSELPLPQFANKSRAVVSSVDATLPPFALRTGNDMIASTIAANRFNMLVVGVFSLLAVGLALSGVYGVVSHFIEQSRRAFGIRQALGATRARIVATVLRWAMAPVLAGITAGGVAAFALATLAGSLVIGVAPNDPVSVLMVAGVVTTMVAVIVLPSALRASRNDIATLLRRE